MGWAILILCAGIIPYEIRKSKHYNYDENPHKGAKVAIIIGLFFLTIFVCFGVVPMLVFGSGNLNSRNIAPASTIGSILSVLVLGFGIPGIWRHGCHRREETR
jgi:uncharacterized membrane protein (DUF485 family)